MTNPDQKPDACREAFEKWVETWPIGISYGAFSGFKAGWEARATPTPALSGWQKEQIDLLKEQLEYDQEMIRESHKLLNRLGAPTNGQEGEGKRQELTLSQRIFSFFSSLPIPPVQTKPSGGKNDVRLS